MQYEYKIIRQELGAVSERLLNEYGDEGWELCATELVEERGFEYTRFVFKRRKFGEIVLPRHDPIEPIRPSPETKPNTRSWRDDVIEEHFGRKSGQLEHNTVLEAVGISRDYGGQEHSAVMEAIGH